jgi:hypothetical protein
MQREMLVQMEGDRTLPGSVWGSAFGKGFRSPQHPQGMQGQRVQPFDRLVPYQHLKQLIRGR